jgi:hypothetical protein
MEKRAFSIIGIIIILVILIGGGYFAWQYIWAPGEEIKDETADWQAYRNEEYGFEVKYPNSLTIEYSNPSQVWFIGYSVNEFKCDFSFYLSSPEGKKPCANITEAELTIDGTPAEKEKNCFACPCVEPTDCPGNIKYSFGPNKDNRCIDTWMVTSKVVSESGTEVGMVVPECEEIFNQILSTFRFIAPVEKEEPYIKILSPNGGEEWKEGKTYTIKWESSGVNKVNIEYGDGKSWYIEQDYPAETGEYSWTPQGIISQYEGFVYPEDLTEVNIKIGIWDAENSNIFDKSDESFILNEGFETTQ